MTTQMDNKRNSIVDIDSFYNVKGISWSEHQIDGSLDHSGDSIPGELLPSGVVQTYRGIQFQLPCHTTNHFDMVSCEGQTVPINALCDEIAFLGMSTFGDHTDFVTISYSDGETDEQLFRISDWGRLFFTNDLFPNEEIGIIFPYRRNIQGNKVPYLAGLSIPKIVIDKQKEISSITLPPNPYIFLASITLIH
ncbi:hypothetical protein AB4Z29_27435 [Paenibacillus sp. 2TAB23]|uniref:hypothetical protein n=1 Tax=Paenibacillus sp. 2TAB23 TaxID=3233004 RepID=UPI003F95F498